MFATHLGRQKEEEGIWFVLKSLNENQKGIIGVLAKYLIEHPTNEVFLFL
jgi:hypothetical protein